MNRKTFLLFLLSVANLLLMHCQIALTVEFEYPFKADAIVSCLLGMMCDATFFLLVGLLVTWGRERPALAIAFVSTWLLSLCNVLYARFFAHYIPNLALTQAGNLADGEVIRCILTGFRPVDVLFLLTPLLFVWLWRRSRHSFPSSARPSVASRLSPLSSLLSPLRRSSLFRPLAVLWGTLLAAVAAFIVILAVAHDPLFKISFMRFSPIRMQFNQAPNNMLFRSGFVRRAITCRDDFLRRDMPLDSAQTAAIEREYTRHTQRLTPLTSHLAPRTSHLESSPNIIFIIVESYLAATSDLTVDGKEITPFLNRLKHDSAVYYNGHMHSNIHIGESSDGQFIYMTGLLPLRSEITVNVMKHKTAPGLPQVLAAQGAIRHSHAIVPTSPTFWEQDAMCRVYGIDTLYSKFDYARGDTSHLDDLNDEQVFQMAARIDSQAPRPFFSMILTMSMHSPYNKSVEPGFTLSDATLSPEYLNYLVACHYLDRQLERYIEALRRSGIYDNSLIIITADHHAHPEHLNMAGRVSSDLPLYIIHGGSRSAAAWTGACHQLDLYTTLLDLCLPRAPLAWRGLGHTLLNPDYSNSLSDHIQQLSELMIWSNYFGAK